MSAFVSVGLAFFALAVLLTIFVTTAAKHNRDLCGVASVAILLGSFTMNGEIGRLLGMEMVLITTLEALIIILGLVMNLARRSWVQRCRVDIIAFLVLGFNFAVSRIILDRRLTASQEQLLSTFTIGCVAAAMYAWINMRALMWDRLDPSTLE